LAADVTAARQGKPGGTIYGGTDGHPARADAPLTRQGHAAQLRQSAAQRERFRGGLLQFIALLNDSRLHDWVVANTSSPNAMVDRITPRPTSDVAERVKRATGWMMPRQS